MMQRFFFNSSRIPCYEQDNFIFKEKKKKTGRKPIRRLCQKWEYHDHFERPKHNHR